MKKQFITMLPISTVLQKCIIPELPTFKSLSSTWKLNCLENQVTYVTTWINMKLAYSCVLTVACNDVKWRKYFFHLKIIQFQGCGLYLGKYAIHISQPSKYLKSADQPNILQLSWYANGFRHLNKIKIYY
jgi:hypothetical protein